MNDLFNQKLKERFLSVYPENTKKAYRHIFKSSKVTESTLNKDVYEFNSDELHKLLSSFNNRSEGVVYVNKSILKQYLDFCIKEGYTNINYLQGFGGSEDLKKYVDKEALKNKYITHEDLNEMEKIIVNRQDIVIPFLIFEGIKGEDGIELSNLKVSDCNFETNELSIYVDDSLNRKIKASYQTMELIKDAIEEKVYEKGNRESEEKSKAHRIIETEYVLRVSGKESIDSKIKTTTIRDRINRIKTKYYNEYITMTNIWYSGMIDMAKKIKEKKGDLLEEDYNEIKKRYNCSANWFQLAAKIKDLV